MGTKSPQSIITQVSKDNDDNTTGVPLESNNDNQLHVQAHEESESEVEVVNGKKGFWRTLCCCFYPRSKTYEETASLPDATVTPTGETYLLPPIGEHGSKKTLVLDLDETLVHSSFKPIPNPDFIIPVEIDDQVHKVYVAKRPGVDEFLKKMGDKFEVVVFTASLSKYADPVLDLLDIHKVIKYRLFREACTNYRGNFVKDLNRLGRDIKFSIIIDNSPSSFMFHPENAVRCESWFDDENDRELLDFIPIFEKITSADDVRVALTELKRAGKLPT